MPCKSSRKHMFSIIIIKWILSCFTTLSTLQQTTGSIRSVAAFATDDAVDAIMEEHMEHFKVIGGVVAFFDKNKQSEPIFGAYGKTRLSDSEALDVTPDTVFMMSYVSLVVTGAAVLILVDRGFISSLDDDICNIMLQSDEFVTSSSSSSFAACRNPKFLDTPITWRMLVSHYSSLQRDVPLVNNKKATYGPTGGHLGEAAGQSECPTEDVVGFYRDFFIDKPTETVVGADLDINWYKVGQDAGGPWRDSEPGTERHFSNIAFGYIAALIELASGETFPDFCANNIFKPLGMNHTAWFRRDLPDDAEEAMPIQHIRRKEFREVGHYCFIDYARGTLRTSARDMSRFLHAMMADYGDGLLFSLDSGLGLQALTCQEPAFDGELALLDGCLYGVGWNVHDNSTKNFRHSDYWMDPLLGLDWTNGGIRGGNAVGWHTRILVLPEAGIYALAFINTDGRNEWATHTMMLDMFKALGYSSSQRLRCTVILSFVCLLLLAFSILF